MTTVPGPAHTVPVPELGRVHFVGIGGAGMSGIARILLARGLTVSGSDAKESVVLASLRAVGARIAVGQSPQNLGDLGDTDTVVVSSAIRDDNIELIEARRRGLRVLPRAAALASVMVGRRAVAVAGTHGKTTTTSLLTVALQHSGADPSFAIGGHLNESGANAHNGTGDVFIAESDESDGSFLLYSPDIAIVTNVEADHLDHYGTAAAVDAAFVAFLDRIVPGGCLVACADDPGSARLLAVAREAQIRTRSYGVSESADLRVDGLRLQGSGSRFDAVLDGEPLGAVPLRIPGRHNALNAAAALLAGVELGLPSAALREGLAAFTGTRRRSEFKGRADGVRVYDDYAHHPTEVEAVLRAFREVAAGGRLVAAFQPHRYSRTAAFREAFGAALGLADEVVVMGVYGAGEDPVPGVGGASVAAAVTGVPVVFEPSWSAVAGRLVERSVPGDVVLTLGAGDVTMLGPEVLDLLAARAAARTAPVLDLRSAAGESSAGEGS